MTKRVCVTSVYLLLLCCSISEWFLLVLSRPNPARQITFMVSHTLIILLELALLFQWLFIDLILHLPLNLPLDVPLLLDLNLCMNLIIFLKIVKFLSQIFP